MIRSKLLTRMLGGYLDLCSRTARWELQGTEELRSLAAAPGGFILGFWHECLPLMPLAWSEFWRSVEDATPRKRGMVLVSRSRDGGMIGALLSRFGLEPVAGSSSAGGTAATRDMLQAMREGAVVVIVPDGPRGPRRRISQGSARIAMMAGVPVVPCGAYAKPCRRLGSWDRMVIPFPFARCVAVVGAPVHVSGGGTEQASALLSESLCAAMAAATLAVEGSRRAAAGRG
ncbi:lysophospholipid acyltransferase family protein [Roseomonas elaeocarpi]|uniref:Lysophospholipid acyltransferase family protein n=1 Tax=Roseomonas elaeocarpi TaxID=907779 RepID=A0ABV6JSJ6_9PROT